MEENHTRKIRIIIRIRLSLRPRKRYPLFLLSPPSPVSIVFDSNRKSVGAIISYTKWSSTHLHPMCSFSYLTSSLGYLEHLTQCTCMYVVVMLYLENNDKM